MKRTGHKFTMKILRWAWWKDWIERIGRRVVVVVMVVMGIMVVMIFLVVRGLKHEVCWEERHSIAGTHDRIS